MEWEKIFTNDISDKEAEYKIDKGAEDMNRHFSKEDIQMTNRHMQRCSTSLLIREIKIKTTLRYHLMLVRVAKMNNSGDYRCCKDVEKWEPYCTFGGNENCCTCSGNSVEVPQKIKNRSTL